jgi:hypothetical protein
MEHNIIDFSRDLLGLPRRWLADPRPRGPLGQGFGLASALGWGLLGLVVGLTARLAVVRKEQARAVTGPAAGFLLLGAWLSCFHFMYYDVLLAALPVFALLAEPGRYLKRRRLAVTFVVMVFLCSAYLNVLLFQIPLDATAGGRAVLLSVARLGALLGLDRWSYPPWDTFCLMALWLCCGWLWLRQRNEGEARSLPGDL